MRRVERDNMSATVAPIRVRSSSFPLLYPLQGVMDKGRQQPGIILTMSRLSIADAPYSNQNPRSIP